MHSATLPASPTTHEGRVSEEGLLRGLDTATPGSGRGVPRGGIIASGSSRARTLMSGSADASAMSYLPPNASSKISVSAGSSCLPAKAATSSAVRSPSRRMVTRAVDGSEVGA